MHLHGASYSLGTEVACEREEHGADACADEQPEDGQQVVCLACWYHHVEDHLVGHRCKHAEEREYQCRREQQHEVGQRHGFCHIDEEIAVCEFMVG